MDEIFTKSFVGTSGFFATLGLAKFNEYVSLAVGLATLIYMIVSIIKIIRGFND